MQAIVIKQIIQVLEFMVLSVFEVILQLFSFYSANGGHSDVTVRMQTVSPHGRTRFSIPSKPALALSHLLCHAKPVFNARIGSKIFSYFVTVLSVQII
jgi:hypothetical protein